VYFRLRAWRKSEKGVPATTAEKAQMSTQNQFPDGWDEDRIREVIEHYDNQTEDEELAELEAAQNGPSVTMMPIPTELVPEVQALIAKKHSA
jgi:hypothetical protein